MTYLIENPFLPALSSSDTYMVTDSEEVFKTNLNYFGEQWIFKNKVITYNLNSYGYRMKKNLEDINFDNYIAFFGCSNTVGVGLPLEDTFSYRIADQLGIDYVNGAIAGASPDFVFYNIVTLFDSVPKLPKIIVIYWPDPSRTCYWENNRLSFYIHNCLPQSTYWHDAYKSYILEDSHIKNTFLIRLKAIRQLCKANDVKLFEFTSGYLQKSFLSKNNIELKAIETIPPHPQPAISHKSMTDWVNVACARDISIHENKLPELHIKSSHPGLYHQDNIIKEFFSFI